MGQGPSDLDPSICDSLRAVLDPEIGLNLVDLGLVYQARRSDEEIDVRLTLTSRACPLSEMVLEEARQQLVQSFPNVPRVNLKLVWDPPWSPDLITDSGYAALGRTRKRELV